MEKYKLGVKERASLLEILPETGNIVILRVLRALRESLGFSVEDFEKFNIKIDSVSGQATWDREKDTGTEIEISEVALDLIKSALTKLNDEDNLKDEHISLWDMFVN